jgi:PPM family protein phosphatase
LGVQRARATGVRAGEARDGMTDTDRKVEDANRRKLIAAALRSDEVKPAAALVRAEFGAQSRRGRVQPGNDDHYLVLRLAQRFETIVTSLASVDLPSPFEQYAYAAVVADGIGHDGAGSIAARLAIGTLAALALRVGHWNMRIDPGIAADVIERSEWLYGRTSDAVFQRSHAEPQLAGMAAALTGIYSVGTDLFVAHVGHSRCYVFRDGLLVQLTRDHTLRERRAISPHPIPVGQAIEDASHFLTHAIGADGNDPGVIVEHFRLADDDSLLLCTNGLTDAISEDAIADVLAARRSLTEQCDLLVDMAVANGADDNATVVIANYHVPQLPADLA